MSFFKPNPILTSKDFQAGVEHGKSQTAGQLLTWLHGKYMDDRVVRHSPEARALLKLTKELADHLREEFNVQP